MYNFRFDNQNIEMLGPYEFECNYSVQDDEFLNSVGHMLGPALLPGNNVLVLNDKAWFTAFTQAEAAKRSICVETTSSWQSPQGIELSDLLATKAESGIPVHLVLPKTNKKQVFSLAQLKKLHAADVEVFSLVSPIKWKPFAKPHTDFTFITVDGAHSSIISPDRSYGFSAQGPIAGQIQAAFNENWMKVQEQVAHGEFYFAASPLTSVNAEPESVNHRALSGPARAQYFDAENIKTPHKLYLNILYAIGIAKENLSVSSAVFKKLPGLEREIQKAQQRGVKINTIKSDLVFLIADELWSSVGVREKAFLNVHNKSFASALAARFNLR